MLHFLQAMGFSQSPVILPLLRRFRNFAKEQKEMDSNSDIKHYNPFVK